MNQPDNLRLLTFTNNQLSDLIEILKDSITSVIISEYDGNIVYVNKVFENRTGYTSSEVMGKNPRFLKSDETDPEKHKKLWETITSGNIWCGEFKNKRKNGKLFWEYSTIHPIIDSNKKITYFLAIKEDITQIKLLEESLDAVINKENQKELKFEFLKQISYEFQSPIHAILSFVQLLRTKCGPDDCDNFISHSTYFDIIYQQSSKVLKSTEMLIDITQIKTETIKVKLNLLNKIFLTNFLKEIREPVATILGILTLLKDGCIKKQGSDYETEYRAVYNACNRIIYTLDIVSECSHNAKDEIKFYKNILSRISEEKEKLIKYSTESVSTPPDIEQLIHYELESKETKVNSGRDKTIISSPEIKFNIESTSFLFKRNQDLLLESKNFQDLTVAFYNTNSASFKTAKNFRNFCGNLMDLGTKKLIVDLSMCNNIDPTFAGALIVVKRALIGANGDMALVLNPKHILIESFALLNLELQFDIYSTVEIAIKNFSSVKAHYAWEYEK